MLAAANQFLASSTEEEQAADPQLYIFKTCSVQPQWTQTQVTSRGNLSATKDFLQLLIHME